MVYDLLIYNAQVVTPGGTIRGAVLVNEGQVAAILTGGDFPDVKERVDAEGNFLLPGVVDIHVHFREPGQEYKGGYASESAAAAVGGVTTICDMPNNGSLAVVNPERVAAKAAAASRSALVDFGIYSYLTNGSIEAKRALQAAGIIGLKWDMSLAGTEPVPGAWLPAVEEALEGFRQAAALGLRHPRRGSSLGGAGGRRPTGGG
jgi:dihydroorotase-like cyclic amidohydrolase